MRFVVRDFGEADARAVAAWRYPPPYDVYDEASDPDDLEALMDATSWPGVYFAVDDADTEALAGFLELRHDGDEVELGLGMSPDLTGQGLGPSFVGTALAFARERWSPSTFALDVLPWNERAIRAYEHAGFVRGEVYVRRFPNGVERTFLRMTRPA
ncbi:MAG: GNAT family N-acetyltransferase [Planctomycetaceae bacterium]